MKGFISANFWNVRSVYTADFHYPTSFGY